MRNIEEVKVGQKKMAFVTKKVLKGLRRLVNVRLAEQGMKHKDAASRAGIPSTGWSRLMNSEEISELDLAKIAKGIGMKVSEVYATCAVESGKKKK